MGLGSCAAREERSSNCEGELVGIVIGPASAGLTQVRATVAQSIVAAFPVLQDN